MDTILSSIESLDLSTESLLKAAGILLIGSLILGFIGHFAFGKRSSLNHSVSSAIGILFIYAATVVLRSAGSELQQFVAPLPFVTFSGDYMYFFQFGNADYTQICSQLVSMIILAFLANLSESWLPKGRNFFSWFLFRCLSIILALILHLIVTYLFETYLPEGIVTYAPAILLGLLLLMLAVGALKFLVGVVIASVNPLIGGLYTFFFATVVGKQLSRAILTTGILCGLVYGLEHFGCTQLLISSVSFVSYAPFMLILVALWYLIGQIL